MIIYVTVRLDMPQITEFEKPGEARDKKVLKALKTEVIKIKTNDLEYEVEED